LSVARDRTKHNMDLVRQISRAPSVRTSTRGLGIVEFDLVGDSFKGTGWLA